MGNTKDAGDSRRKGTAMMVMMLTLSVDDRDEALQKQNAVDDVLIECDAISVVQLVLYEVSNAVGNAVVMNGRLIGCDGQ